MSSKWGTALAISCWGIAGGLGLLNLVEMGLLLAEDEDFILFRGGKGTIVVQALIDLVWQAGIFTMAGLVFFSLRRA